MINGVANVLFTEELYHIHGKTVVVSSEPWEKLTEDERALLQKIMQAVKLSLDAVIIINQSNLDIASLKADPSRVIFFGTVEGMTPFEPQTQGDIQVITSPPLEQLLKDATAKQKLWAGLKVLFNR